MEFFGFIKPNKEILYRLIFILMSIAGLINYYMGYILTFRYKMETTPNQNLKSKIQRALTDDDYREPGNYAARVCYMPFKVYSGSDHQAGRAVALRH